MFCDTNRAFLTKKVLRVEPHQILKLRENRLGEVMLQFDLNDPLRWGGEDRSLHISKARMVAGSPQPIFSLESPLHKETVQQVQTPNQFSYSSSKVVVPKTDILMIEYTKTQRREQMGYCKGYAENIQTYLARLNRYFTSLGQPTCSQVDEAAGGSANPLETFMCRIFNVRKYCVPTGIK